MRAEAQATVDAIEKSLNLLAQRMDWKTAAHRLEEFNAFETVRPRDITQTLLCSTSQFRTLRSGDHRHNDEPLCWFGMRRQWGWPKPAV